MAYFVKTNYGKQFVTEVPLVMTFAKFCDEINIILDDGIRLFFPNKSALVISNSFYDLSFGLNEKPWNLVDIDPYNTPIKRFVIMELRRRYASLPQWVKDQLLRNFNHNKTTIRNYRINILSKYLHRRVLVIGTFIESRTFVSRWQENVPIEVCTFSDIDIVDTQNENYVLKLNKLPELHLPCHLIRSFNKITLYYDRENTPQVMELIPGKDYCFYTTLSSAVVNDPIDHRSVKDYKLIAIDGSKFTLVDREAYEKDPLQCETY